LNEVTSTLKKMNTKPSHIPVLLEKTVELLNPKAGETYFDGTAGYGGHAAKVAEALQPGGRMILVDRDQQAINALSARFKQADIRHLNYTTAMNQLLAAGDSVDMVLLDLGVSSPQLDTDERGFSFSHEAPLDMRMDQSQDLTATDVVNGASESELADILYGLGEERRSRRIARLIVENRPINTTGELRQAVHRAIGPRSGRIDSATRTFQALRIYVNDELAQLEEGLELAIQLLNPGGRVAVISFHSLEDRLVKQFFRNHAELQILTKKAIKGSAEDTLNPRARSAKLRAAVKINKNKRSQNDITSQGSANPRPPHQSYR
jgi:16S rRNA (cytosine1402-N4)-methyltransferase